MFKQNLKNKLILVNVKTWKEFKKIAKFYGREIPFALNDALVEYIKTRKKEIEKSNNEEE